MSRLSATLLLLAFACAFFAGYASRPSGRGADQIKAEYIFLEAANARDSHSLDDYYMMLRRAASLDPEDPYIRGALAEVDILLPTVDSSGTEAAYADLCRRFLADPLSEPNAERYIDIATRLRRYDDVISAWELLDSLQPSRTDPAMNLATVLVNKGATSGDQEALRRAVDIIGRLQQTQPGNPTLASHKIAVLNLMADTAAMVSELARFHREAPADMQAMLFISSTFEKLGMADSASRYLDFAEQIDSENGALRLARANYFLNRGDSATFISEVLKAMESPSMEYAMKFDILRGTVSTLFADTSRHSQIEHMFGVLQEVNPGEASLHTFYAEYQLEKDNNEAAAEHFRYSVDLEPSDQEVWDRLLYALGKCNDTERIAEASKETLRRFPSDAYAALMGATALVVQNKESMALGMIDSLDIEFGQEPRILSHLFLIKGDLLYKAENVDSALAAYDKAISFNADNYMALNNAAYFMAEEDRTLGRAELYASIAVAAEPENSTFLDTYAWVMFKKRDYQRAKELIDQALSICLRNEDEEESVTDENAEESENAISAEIYDHAGDIYFMSGNPAEAVEFWGKALELDPDNERIRRKHTNRAYFYE